MKRKSRFCLLVILTLVFAVRAGAGDISCGITSTPEAASSGEMHTGVTGEIPNPPTVRAIAQLSEFASSLLKSILSLS